MSLTPDERSRLRDLLFDRYHDWQGVRNAAAAKRVVVSESSLLRLFNGRSNSPRTVRCLAQLLGSTSDALLTQVRLAPPSASPAASARHTLRDPEAFRVAYQLWVEMTTRKLGQPIDPAHDLVVECYNSWYAFFTAARELMKAIPLHRNPRSPELGRLVQLSQAVLNDGLRPHLERWQARFRAWLLQGGDRAQAGGLSPQEAQQLFPQWPALREDLLAANQRLIGYLATLDAMLGQPAAAGKRSRSRG